MGDGVDDLWPSEGSRLSACATEPIHLIDRVQSHGTLLGVREGRVEVASEDRAEWLGLPLADVAPGLADLVDRSPTGAINRITLEGAEFDVVLRSGGPGEPVLVELVPLGSEAAPGTLAVCDAAFALANGDVDDDAGVEALPGVVGVRLMERAAELFHQLTGFERVLGYRFRGDGHGEIVAEVRPADMESYVGLRFPASDIPPQARSLYVRKRSRSIYDTDDPGRELRYLEGAPRPMDLGLSELRRASSYHLDYMRNMGQVATLSLSLVHDGHLIGMFTCAHRQPRRVSVSLQHQLEVIAQQVASQLAASERIARLTRQLDVTRLSAALVTPLYSAPLTTIVKHVEPSLFELVPCDGVYVRGEELESSAGELPDMGAVRAALASFGDREVVAESLVEDFPELAADMPGFAGMIALPLQAGDAWLVFFRRDVAQDVLWLGDQRPENRDGPLSPRRSFSRWRESVTGRSLPWGAAADAARVLARDVGEALVARERARLAELALQDDLTGLPNRRFLTEYVEQHFDDSADGFAAIFIDLDRFKAVNDTFGHDAGDEVLRTVAGRLKNASRTNDLVVRLGGDEFVMVCREVTPEVAHAIAGRLVAALSEPMIVEGHEVQVGASAGVALGAAGETLDGLLDVADAAMYRAKRGRTQVEVADGRA